MTQGDGPLQHVVLYDKRGETGVVYDTAYTDEQDVPRHSQLPHGPRLTLQRSDHHGLQEDARGEAVSECGSALSLVAPS